MYNTIVTVEISLEHSDEPAKAIDRFARMITALHEVELVKAETNYRKAGSPLKAYHKMNIERWTDD